MEKKITVQCCVPSCTNTNHMSPQILFFPFPKRREMQEKWLHAIRRPELKKMLPVDKPFHMFICLKHFHPSDVVQINQRTCLRAGVIPSVFKWSTPLPDVKLATSPGVSTSSTPDSVEAKLHPSSINPESKEAIRRKLESNKSCVRKGSILDDIVIIHCGKLKAELHRDKFYCPGIHRECIKYNNQFITPKMFMIMGDKEKLKDWKNALRVGGVKIRKFIESKQLDFHKHKEFCTGRCVARLPTGLFRTKNQPPEDDVNTSGDISHIKFAEGDNKPETQHFFRVEPVIETEYDDEDEDSDDSIVDVKPDIETLNALLKNPIPTTMLTKGPSTEHGITDNQMFWRGISKLGLLDTVFEVVKDSFNMLRSNFIIHDARAEDAHLLSSIIREMGLSNKIQHMLASSKQEMDHIRLKLDKEMHELQEKVNQCENRKRMLEKRSEDFSAILEMNNPKNQTFDETRSASDDTSVSSKRQADSPPEENIKRFKISHSEQLKRILQSPQNNSPGESSTTKVEDTQPQFVLAKDNLKPGQILKIIPSETGGQPIIIQKTFDADDSNHKTSEESPMDQEDNLPKIVSVQSIKGNVVDNKNSSSNCSDDIKPVEDMQNGVATGQSLTEQILKSAGKKSENDDHDDDDIDEDDMDDDDLLETMEMYGGTDESSAQMKVIKDPDNPNSQLIIWKRSDGKAETFRFSNNSKITQSSDEKTDSGQSADEKTEKPTNQEKEISETKEKTTTENEEKVTNENEEKVTNEQAENENGNTLTNENGKSSSDEIQENSAEEDNKNVETNQADDNLESKSAPSEETEINMADLKSMAESKNDNSGVDSDSTSIPEGSTPETIATRRSSRKRIVKKKDDL